MDNEQLIMDNVQLPDGWEMKELKDLVNIRTGKLNANAMIEGGQYPFFTCSREIFSIDKYAFDCEAILLAGNNASGDFNVKHYKGKFNAYQRTYVITVNEKHKVLYGYLNHQLLNHLKKFKEQSVGANTKFLKLGMIQGMKIPLPPLPEQKRIVAILDHAFEAIDQAKANAQQNLKNAKELFESYLNRVFEEKGSDWEEKPLKELSKINYGYTEKAKFENIGPKFLRITDIQNNIVNWETVPYCKVNDEDLPKYKLEKGDIVFARTGATTGKSYLIQNPPISVFASYLIRLKLIDKDKFDAKFIMYFFNTKYYWDKINSGISGSTQGGFNATKLGNLNLVFPKPLETQKQIVQQLDALQAETKKLEAIYQQKIVDLEELKKSILQKAFNGEL